MCGEKGMPPLVYPMRGEEMCEGGPAHWNPGRIYGIIAASTLFSSGEYVKADARAGAAKQAVPMV